MKNKKGGIIFRILKLIELIIIIILFYALWKSGSLNCTYHCLRNASWSDVWTNIPSLDNIKNFTIFKIK